MSLEVIEVGTAFIEVPALRQMLGSPRASHPAGDRASVLYARQGRSVWLVPSSGQGVAGGCEQGLGSIRALPLPGSP